jgi:hypothetical protein
MVKKSMKKKIYYYLPLGIAVIFTVFGVHQILQARVYRMLELKNDALQRELRLADGLADHQLAISHYKRLDPAVSEVQLRILQRQWLIALDDLHQMQLAKFNPILEKEVPVLSEKLGDHLDEMKDRCHSLLSKPNGISPDVTWRVYNISGAANLLKAFMVLETEGNWKKISGILKEAISNLKASIDSVGDTTATRLEKNIPRWNLELLYGKKYVRQIALTRIDTAQRLELKENLEAIIPEKGGYAPGEPMETRIQK